MNPNAYRPIRPTASANQPPPNPNPDTSDNKIYERTDAYGVTSGAAMRKAVFDGYRSFTLHPGPITVRVGRNKATTTTSVCPDFDPYAAVAICAMERGYSLYGINNNLRASIKDICCAAFYQVDESYVTLPTGSKFTAAQFIDLCPDPGQAAALAVRNLLMGVVIHPLLVAALPDLPQRVMAEKEVRIDIEALHQRLFFTDSGGTSGHEMRLTQALNAVSTRIILDRPVQQHIRPLCRVVDHICQLHAKSNGGQR
ncbi:hypothetical protein LCM28_05625 [Salipiger pacificus]|nr:hypothetical protein [Alloyangia pacifica]